MTTNPDQYAESVAAKPPRCKASISGNCLSLYEGGEYCEVGECIYDPAHIDGLVGGSDA